jgi:hypothetical protein
MTGTTLKAFTDLRPRDIQPTPGGKTEEHYSSGKPAFSLTKLTSKPIRTV